MTAEADESAVSDRKRAANRANALKSTGPRTEEGKERVRLNALKHGLRSEEVVLPGEDGPAFDAMLGSWMLDWRPPTDARRLLVEQAVAHGWRLRRCLKLERDHLVERGRRAVRAHRAGVAARVAEAVAGLGERPTEALAALYREREGVVALLGLWGELVGPSASADTWDDFEGHHMRLMALLGFGRGEAADAAGGAAHASWRVMAGNDPAMHHLEDDLPADDAEAAALASGVAALVAEQVADLTRHLAERFAPPEAHEARVASEAAPDDSAEGRALLRYEGQHGRAFRATLGQLIKLTRTGVDLVDDGSSDAGGSTQAVLSQVVEVAEAVAPGGAAAPSTPVESVAPNKATEAVAAPDEAESVVEAPIAPDRATDPTNRAIDRHLAAHRRTSPGAGTGPSDRQ